MKYHVPESAGYTRTVAEVWFNSEEAAKQAGFVRAQRVGQLDRVRADAAARPPGRRDLLHRFRPGDDGWLAGPVTRSPAFGHGRSMVDEEDAPEAEGAGQDDCADQRGQGELQRAHLPRA